MKKFVLSIALFSIYGVLFAQYAPPVGEEGTTAIYKDSSLFVDWAKNVEVFRGLLKITDEQLGYASYGSDDAAVGAPDGAVVSLGDSGIAVYSFEIPIVNKQGCDFAVFENSFSNEFLELAFVEVSSDGVRYVRFPAVSNTQNTVQIDGFGVVDATKIYNLAGKYKANYGTPFDLSELADSSSVDINRITHVKIIDVIGDITDTIASFDSKNNIINDPWPTPFASGGFDLDALGVIHNENNAGIEENSSVNNDIYPNPCTNSFNLLRSSKEDIIDIFDISGKRVMQQIAPNDGETVINISGLNKGVYFVRVTNDNAISRVNKIVKR